ncbi:hypothetical protein MNEG_7090 [Monoraphidium neglectum]|uniref:Uncharacterized protein n=1 Tax=Monoraphidium neglectum TaxID=145388 RepID=A0A0D2MC98_9CHLO|nr:hypothetical protein MNEG_7090 [Monoraphidium neglectum]KIZ00875.1 hypothetical protein MNEG_7090 [Monoraphidium neglectum]|eukprot:XP_013899894.1 hypothetical protein MNEG_7090 [Monoraphidium neglectum]
MRRRAAALALGLLVLCGCMVGSLQQSEADAADEPETAAPPAEAAEASSAERAAPSAAAKAATAQSSAGAKAEEAAAPAAAAAGEQAPKAKQQPAVSKGTSQAASQAKGDAAAAPAPAPAAKAAPKPKPAAKPTPAAVPAAAEGGQPPSKGAEAAPGPEQVAAPEPQPERVAAAEDQPAPAAGEEEEQPKRQGPKLLPKKVQVVAAAPEAEVENDDDIDPQGDCADFIPSSSCKDVDFGDGRVAECLSQIIAAAEAADTEAEGESVPIACASELATFFIKRSKNINANVPLARACKADAERLCNNTYLFGGKTEGQVISCLK